MLKYISGGAISGCIAFWIFRTGDFTPLAILIVLGIVVAVILKEKLPIGNSFSTTAVAKSLTTFDSIGGQDSAKREIMEALDFLKDQEYAKKLGIRPIKGILLSGPPGTGKTLLAKAASSYTSSTFVAHSGSEFIEMYAGVGASRVRKLFDKAKKLAKAEGNKNAIIFIDEIEILGGKRGSHTSHHEYDQTLNQLLVEMDGIKNSDDILVLVIGATNREDMLDSALLRPGRFDRVVKVDLPDKTGRLQILNIHTRNKPLGEDVDLEQISQETFDFSGAHLENTVNEAAIYALREKSISINNEHFKNAIDKVLLGETIDRKIKTEEKKRITYHESGHAIVTQLLLPGSIAKVTIVGRGKALGYVRHVPQEESFVYTKSYFEDQIAIFLAGAIAEEVIFGDYCSGASADFQQVWKLGKEVVRSGLSELGIVPEEFLAKDNVQVVISEIIKKQIDRVNEILVNHRDALDAITQTLLINETIEGNEIANYLEIAS